ncbi:MAG: hypothetical protein QM489_05205 [Candidatus Izemoplasma sp.]
MSKLLIVWKSDNLTDINTFVIPYAYNAKTREWFEDVEVLIWGASQEAVMESTIVQQRVQNLIKNEIKVVACKMCANNTGALELLESLGVEVYFTGQYLTEKIKDKDTEIIYI